jgi:hypothetical protein
MLLDSKMLVSTKHNHLTRPPEYNVNPYAHERPPHSYAWYPDFFFFSLLLVVVISSEAHTLTRQHVLELFRRFLLCQLEQLLIGVYVAGPVVIVIVISGCRGLASLGLLAFLLDENDRGRTLGLGGAAKLEARPDEEVGNVVLLAVDGQVHDDLVGRDVSRDDADPRDLVRVGWCLDGRLAERLVDFLDAALKGACLPGCFEEKIYS